MKTPIILLLKLYQLCISPLLGNCCRFYPSCSDYGIEAVNKYGVVKGMWLIFKRLIRCHPWNPGGVDHP